MAFYRARIIYNLGGWFGYLPELDLYTAVFLSRGEAEDAALSLIEDTTGDHDPRLIVL